MVVTFEYKSIYNMRQISYFSYQRYQIMNS